MKKVWSAILICLALVLALTGCSNNIAKPSTPPPAQPAEIIVSAAISLKDALTEIQQTYQAKNPQAKLTFNFGASGTLEKQIEEGAPVDVFISAATKQMDDLEKKNLLKANTRKNLLENQLVLIVPKDSKLPVKEFGDLAKEQVKSFAMGTPESVPAGQYTQQALKKLGIADAVQPKAVMGKDVRAVLTYVETGNVDAGTVYRTDAAVSDKVKIIGAAPAGSHDPIIYPMAVLGNSKQAEAAAQFTAFLSTPEAKTIFEKYGFVMSK